MMESLDLELSITVPTAFTAFVGDRSYFALPLAVRKDAKLEPLPPVLRRSTSFQSALNELDGVLTSSNACYLILRRDDSYNFTFITYVPYRAKESERALLLENRHLCVQQLGEQYFASSVICKEVGEITDARSWEERDAEKYSQAESGLVDAGYKKNKCRLCDRRMKNKISPEALEALTKLDDPGTAVQFTVNVSTEILELNYFKELAVPDVAATLPRNTPSFTFYRHPVTRLLYFIFHSPDSASVQERMRHTMAIPGLINVHASDLGIHVDQKIEIHDPDDLVFEAEDERIGKFRSMYLRNESSGTESTYKNLEADKAFYDAVK